MNAAIGLLSRQGYVPSTCTLLEPVAFPLIMSEVGAGRSPCWGCNHDRAVCQGDPKWPSEGKRRWAAGVRRLQPHLDSPTTKEPHETD